MQMVLALGQRFDFLFFCRCNPLGIEINCALTCLSYGTYGGPTSEHYTLHTSKKNRSVRTSVYSLFRRTRAAKKCCTRRDSKPAPSACQASAVPLAHTRVMMCKVAPIVMYVNQVGECFLVFTFENMSDF